MKKIILALMLISTICIFTGCTKDNSTDNKSVITAETKNYTETTSKDKNGNKVVTKNFKNGMIEKEVYKGNKIIRTYKHPDGYEEEITEETTIDKNGNKVVNKKYNDGTEEQEIYEGNKITRIHKNPDGGSDKSVEETFEDGTRTITHTNMHGRIYKFTEKKTGEGKRHRTIDKQLKDGTMERIEEDYEKLDKGKHKITKRFQDGRIQEMFVSHNKDEDITETIVTYPDGKKEKTIEQVFHLENNMIKTITTHPDGSKTEHIEDMSEMR